MSLGWRKLGHLKFWSAALGGGQLFAVSAATATACFIFASGQLGHVIGDIQRCDVNRRPLGLHILRTEKEERNEQQRHDASVQADGENLGPAEVFVLGPDVLNLDGPTGYLQRRQLGGSKKLFEPVTKATKIRTPGDRQAAVDWALRDRARVEELFEVFGEPVAVDLRHQRGFDVAVDRHRPFGEKLL